MHVCMCARSLLNLCNPMDFSPPGASVPGILQARTLEWVPFPLPRDLPNPGIEPTFLMSPALAGGFFTNSTTWEGFPGDLVKNQPALQETWAQSLGQEDPLEKGMVTLSSILAWRIQWTEEPGGLQPMGLQRAGQE